MAVILQQKEENFSHTYTHTHSEQYREKIFRFWSQISRLNPNFSPSQRKFPVELLSFTAALSLTLEVPIENSQRARNVSIEISVYVEYFDILHTKPGRITETFWFPRTPFSESLS